MKNESQLARVFMQELKRQPEMGDPTVFRNVSLYVHGIPDYSVTVGRTTFWLEFKLHRPGRKPNFSTKQAQTVKKLKNGLFLVFKEIENEIFVVTAKDKEDYENASNDVRRLQTPEDAIRELVQRIYEQERHCHSLGA